ncbi:hypothetical protein [Alkalibacillus haloalkaliphilus]|uniref:Uncharacterized protein n=1 Tax=Alkalibacillus haloalkaliphilus TaxID=94136 RepID=A0A511W677_9BACI|nr:hypothetical protein [Alkalibacillus haloalkaliphilus]GEN46487.1 hypothetical protein AHA02nite_22630 [Alkalibacillus haloalkaliphilus]
MRLIGWAVVIFIIFQLGVEFGQTEDQVAVIQQEEQLAEQETDSFSERHERIIQDQEIKESQTGLYSVASLIETYVKNIFTFLFHIFHRLAATFGL